MARTHGLAVVGTIAAGVGLWFWLAMPGDDAAPPLPAAGGGSSARAPAAPDVDAAERAPAEAPAPPPAAVPGPTPLPVEPAPSEPAAANVELRAFDLVSKTPLVEFQWRFQPVQGAVVRGTGTAGAVRLSLPAGDGELFAECKEHAPASQRLVVTGGIGPAQRLDLYLPPAAVAAGVRLQTRDGDGKPVPQLRLDLWKLKPGAEEPAPGTDPPGPPLWSRTATNDGGTYPLPDLPAGRLVLRAQPVDLDGDALPWQPWRHSFTFAGHESIEHAVEFAPGVVVALRAEAVAGVDAPAHELAAVVFDPAGTALRLQWRSRNGDHNKIATNMVTLPGAASTWIALPPASYRVAVSEGGVELPLAAAAAPPRMQAYVVPPR